MDEEKSKSIIRSMHREDDIVIPSPINVVTLPSSY